MNSCCTFGSTCDIIRTNKDCDKDPTHTIDRYTTTSHHKRRAIFHQTVIMRKTITIKGTTKGQRTIFLTYETTKRIATVLNEPNRRSSKAIPSAIGVRDVGTFTPIVPLSAETRMQVERPRIGDQCVPSPLRGTPGLISAFRVE